MDETFGATLRRLRQAAGMSMGELAGRINYTKGYLSKIENDLKPPNPTVARLCDGALDARGALIAKVQPSPQPEAPPEATGEEAWVMTLHENGELRFQQFDRRQVLAGAGAMVGSAFVRGPRPTIDRSVLASLRASFEQSRLLGQQTSPAVVLGQVIAQVHTLRALARDNPEPVRSELLVLASRVAEYVGWMCQESGDERAAVWWTRRAVALAEAGRDRELSSYALVREAEIALYQQDAISTIELSQRAQAGPGAGLRVLGLAARCEAQGHALAGDLDACLAALDRAGEYLDTHRAGAGRSEAIVLGSSTVADQVLLARGWALCDLGRAAEAAALLDRSVVTIPVTARRARARFNTRRVLAHAQSGEIDHACGVLGEVLGDAAQVDSATVRTDLRQVARTLNRWHNHRAVRNVYPELTGVLRAPRSSG
ncbi:MAG TPA: helix-turn-helix transcriptional regulator [Actinophytocola sp.]|uniref:helix-turn-helix domain-containing protein n=1 Tax=Actinophytocola sp. TaxID=1872138 RepID=UPI002DBCC2AB|nr:helix-turn-helix transcriptional regulator [Actinophytocola sp.]HEU5475612.1 helix-turn-helix transcriptional regulator [Actinophytocola sp.]